MSFDKITGTEEYYQGYAPFVTDTFTTPEGQQFSGINAPFDRIIYWIKNLRADTNKLIGDLNKWAFDDADSVTNILKSHSDAIEKSSGDVVAITAALGSLANYLESLNNASLVDWMQDSDSTASGIQQSVVVLDEKLEATQDAMQSFPVQIGALSREVSEIMALVSELQQSNMQFLGVFPDTDHLPPSHTGAEENQWLLVGSAPFNTYAIYYGLSFAWVEAFSGLSSVGTASDIANAPAPTDDSSIVFVGPVAGNYTWYTSSPSMSGDGFVWQSSDATSDYVAASLAQAPAFKAPVGSIAVLTSEYVVDTAASLPPFTVAGYRAVVKSGAGAGNYYALGGAWQPTGAAFGGETYINTSAGWKRRHDNVPMASSTVDGYMPKTSFAQLAKVTADVENIKNNGIKRGTFATFANMPTTANDARWVLGEIRVNDTARVETYTLGNRTGEAEFFCSAITNNVVTMNFDGWVSGDIPIFTEGNPGTIVGADEPGKVFAESDGTGSVVGWDTLCSEVTDAHDGLASLRSSYSALKTVAKTGSYTDLTNKPTIPTIPTAASMAASVLPYIYPVGSLYFNATSSTNPATLLGFGTWVLNGAGRVPVCVDSSDADINSAGKTVGVKTVTLTEAQMPSHGHWMHGHGHAFYGDRVPEHYHGRVRSGYRRTTDTGTGTAFASFTVRESGHVGELYDSSTWNSDGFYSANVTGSISNWDGATSGYTGGGQPHENRPPEIAVYIWKRTA